MGLEEIEKKIIGEAQAVAQKIKAQAEEEVSKIIAAGQKEAEIVRQNILKEAQKKAQEIKNAIIIPARLSAKRKILEEKHKILNEVFADLPDEIRTEKEVEVAKFLYE